MPFPDSLTLFDKIDVSDSVDMIEKLDGILSVVGSTSSKLLLMQNTQSDMKACLDTLCSKESLAVSNDAGWTVLV